MADTVPVDTPIIVLHPGSLNLRLGTASNQTPVVVPHCIARRRVGAALTDVTPPPMAPAPLSPIERCARGLMTECGLFEDAVWTCDPSVVGEANRSGATYEAARPVAPSPVAQHLSRAGADFLVGEAALCASPETYRLQWPLRGGYFDRQRPATAVLRDLKDIWSCAMERHLGVGPASFPNYRCIVLVPDRFVRRELCALANLVLVELGFAGLVLHLESVCTTFGIGLPSACVVDVGDQKVSISCVEDGISLPESRLCLPYGGSDVTAALAHLLQSSAALPAEVCEEARRGEGRANCLVRKIKEAVCTMEGPEPASEPDSCRRHSVEVSLPDWHMKASFNLGNEGLAAAMLFFTPGAFNKDVTFYLEDQQTPPPDPCWDDPLEDLMLITRQASNSSKKKHSPRKRKKRPGPDCSRPSLPTLDDAIFTSISRVESEETRFKLLCCVVLVGSGLSFPGANRCLESLLLKRQWEKHLSPSQRSSLDSSRPDVIAQFKDVASGDAAWVGAAIMTRVDFIHELWITPEDWLRHGTRILREMAPFQW